ncbi:MAG: hypothetical protein WA714_13915, partial [Candidatus Acidiferrales bacterium]
PSNPSRLNSASKEGKGCRGLRVQNRGGHGIPEKVMVEELTSTGLQVEKVIEDWSGRDYCVIFVKRSP